MIGRGVVYGLRMPSKCNDVNGGARITRLFMQGKIYGDPMGKGIGLVFSLSR